MLEVTGGGISLTTQHHRGQLCVTDTVTSTLEELQYTLGEGPSLDDEEGNLADTLAADTPFADPIGKRRLVPCLEKLAEMQRKAILMCYVHGYTNEELSRRLDRPLGTVKSWLSRGLAELRKCME